MVGRILTATIYQGKAQLITVESHIADGGIPSFNLVGLPDSAVRESRLRVETALPNDGFHLPPRKILINLAPADVRKEGTGCDLAIALAVLCGHGLLAEADCSHVLVVGELGLGGELRAVPGAVLYVELARTLGLAAVILPATCAEEGALVPGVKVYAAHRLCDVVSFIQRTRDLELATPPEHISGGDEPRCLSEVHGRESEKWALAVAAVGGHHVLLEGSPGVGKTMLAERFSGMLPIMTQDEQVEVLSLYSLLRMRPPLPQRPFRAPHHSLSQPALLGGGPHALPGEVSLAHCGVLFLDELSEIRPDVVNGLRQPLESGRVVIARAQRRAEYPAHFQLIAATNPCPCGNRGHALRVCRCAPTALERYTQRLRGPVVDRLDIVLQLGSQTEGAGTVATSTEHWRHQVEAARGLQQARGQSVPNASLIGAELARCIPLSEVCKRLLRQAAVSMALSERAQTRIRRAARSIADLSGETNVTETHLHQALSLRIERLAPSVQPQPIPRRLSFEAA